MINRCPLCGFLRNIEGSDHCEKCGAPLTELSEPRRRTPVERNIHSDTIAALQPRAAVCVPSDRPVGLVMEHLVEQAIGCVVVVDGDAVVGIFSERDALKKLNAEARELAQRPVRDFMTPHPASLGMNDKVALAMHKMDLGGYRHLPIVDNGRAVGVISIRDLLRYLTEMVMG